MLRNLLSAACKKPLIVARSYHQSKGTFMGFNEFFDQLQPDEAMTAGRAWTAADLRRKSFDDLHSLWWVLYKERNLLLTSRLRTRRRMNAVSDFEESRYIRVKRSMAAIRFVMDEREKIDKVLAAKIASQDATTNETDSK